MSGTSAAYLIGMIAKTPARDRGARDWIPARNATRHRQWDVWHLCCVSHWNDCKNTYDQQRGAGPDSGVKRDAESAVGCLAPLLRISLE